MKVCLNCGSRFNEPGWCCAHCGYEPDQSLGYPQFAPEFAKTAEGFDASYFTELIRFEAGSFWFESRNALIVWAMRNYFPKAATFMEVGCGTGFVLLGLRNALPGLALAGSEIFNGGLTIIKQRNPDAALFQMDIEHIPFADEFDVIGAFDVLEHIPNDEAALRQMTNAVKPGGGILITVPQHPRLWSAFDTHSHHQRRYTRRELVEKVERAGLEVKFVTSFVTLLLPAMIVSRRRQREVAQDYDLFEEFALHPLLNRVFATILTLERQLIRLGLSLPVGGSLLMVATRPAKVD